VCLPERLFSGLRAVYSGTPGQQKGPEKNTYTVCPAMSPNEPEHIRICGAREHNLKNINVTLPRNRLCVITGLSGSGKSSLAFDTLYAEGQRRYVESLSAYARQFLGLMEKPDVDFIEGLSPAISIEQKATGRNPRSTVATVTEIYDYLRLLFARIGVVHCPSCGKKIARQTVQQIVDTILEFPENERIQVLAPVVRGRKGEYRKLFREIERDGFVRIRVNGEIVPIEDAPELDKQKKRGSRKGPEGGESGGSDRFLKRSDKNNDGKVSKDEFDGPDKHFDHMDKDGDGFLSGDEVPTGPPDGKKRN